MVGKSDETPGFDLIIGATGTANRTRYASGLDQNNPEHDTIMMRGAAPVIVSGPV